MSSAMSDDRSSDVMGALPRSRPHRRSDKRATRPAETKDAASGVPPAKVAKTAGRPAKGTNAGARPAKATKAGVPPAGGRKAPTKPRATEAKAAERKRPTTARAQKPAAQPAPRSRKSTPRSGRTPLQQPAQPTGTPDARRADRPEQGSRHDILGTAVQAAAELAEIGLTVGARALRGAVSRLPRP